MKEFISLEDITREFNEAMENQYPELMKNIQKLKEKLLNGPENTADQDVPTADGSV